MTRITETTPSALSKVCQHLLEIDKSIRFAGIANKEAQMMAYAYRENLEPLLTAKETEISVLQSVIRSSTRKTLEAKLGRTLYSLTAYEKVKRVTIPLKPNSGELAILMMSFDASAIDVEQIVVKNILPQVDELISF